MSGARLPLTAVVITLNEERNIEGCIESVAWCDRLLVVDSFSTDRTLELCRARGAHTVQRRWNGINEQRQFALGLVESDWVLALDADERVSPELREEIERLLAGTPDRDAYLVPRHTYYLGRWIEHGGWYPDLKVRLFRKDRGRYAGTDPHDRFEPASEPGRLAGEIRHFTYRNFAHQLRQIDAFSDVAAAEWERAGHSFRLFRLVFRPIGKFLETYVWKRGFLDGLPGFIIAVSTAYYMFVKYVKLWERTRGISSAPPPVAPAGTVSAARPSPAGAAGPSGGPGSAPVAPPLAQEPR